LRYVCIDIETAGLSRDCSVIEFGAVIDDLSKPFDPNAPKFHTYVTQGDGMIHGEPYALALHQKIIDRISKREKGWEYTKSCLLPVFFKDWLVGHGFEENKDTGEVAITVGGKNFAMFDRDFLEPLFADFVRFNHRVLDPVMLYLSNADTKMPDSKTCMDRAGMFGKVAHTAIEDAVMVCELIRRGFGWYPNEGFQR
jgi:hypothetical protein